MTFVYLSHYFLLQISSNGLISFGREYEEFIPNPFPISQFVVAPYWDDITLISSGSVQYELINRTGGSSVHLLDQVEQFISQEVGNNFRASWMLVARWINVCFSGRSPCDAVSDLLIGSPLEQSISLCPHSETPSRWPL